MENDGEKKSSNIKKLVCFGIKLKRSIYSAQKGGNDQINLKSNGYNLYL